MVNNARDLAEIRYGAYQSLKNNHLHMKSLLRLIEEGGDIKKYIQEQIKHYEYIAKEFYNEDWGKGRPLENWNEREY